MLMNHANSAKNAATASPAAPATASARPVDQVHIPAIAGVDWPILAWMVAAHAIALYAIPHVTWTGFAAFAVTYFLTACLGITMGYHRLFTHRTFKAPRWVERTLAVCGTLALQGSVLEWVAHHRMHHAFGDTPRDPHNAHKGFWHSHMGWILIVVPEFDSKEHLRRFGRDIYADPFLRWLSTPLAILGLQLALGLGLWAAFGLEVMLWGVFVRVVAVYHATWLVNSACHKFGYKNHPSDDLATNCWWVALLTFGEGWHNNHHAQGTSAQTGEKWWELDVTWLLVRAMRAVGLATDVKTPTLAPVSRMTPPPSDSLVYGGGINVVADAVRAAADET